MKIFAWYRISARMAARRPTCVRVAGPAVAFCLALSLSGVTTAAPSAEEKPDTAAEGQDIVIQQRAVELQEQAKGGGPDEPVIVPARPLDPRTTQPEAEGENAKTEAPEAPEKQLSELDPHKYRDIYEAIPFNRTEYEANPSYRHEATIELLLGEPRPKVVLRSPRWIGPASNAVGPALNYVSPYQVLSPYIRVSPYRPFPIYDFSRGPYSRYQGLFGYRGGYRSMYYLGGGYYRPYSY